MPATAPAPATWLARPAARARSAIVAESEPLHAAFVVRQLERHARNTPGRVAFTFVREDGREESLDYGELDARVDALAGLLAQAAEPGERALLLYPPGLAFVTAFFACL